MLSFLFFSVAANSLFLKLKYLGPEHVAVYCPYWVVNETEFALRLSLTDWGEPEQDDSLAGQPLEGVPPWGRGSSPFLLSPFPEQAPRMSSELRLYLLVPLPLPPSISGSFGVFFVDT